MFPIVSALIVAAFAAAVGTSHPATASPGMPVSGQPATASATAEKPLSLYTSLSQRTLYVYVSDSVAATYPVAIGKDAHTTPTGT